MDAKNQYKKLGGKRGLKKIETSSDGSLVNTKTAKKVNPEDYVKATRYKDLYRTTVPERISQGLAFVSTSASVAAMLAAGYAQLNRYR